MDIALLKTTLATAYMEARAQSALMEDGGTCCMDCPTLSGSMTRKEAKAVSQVLAELGLRARSNSFGDLVLTSPSNAQGTPRTWACEYVRDALVKAGFKASVHYVID